MLKQEKDTIKEHLGKNYVVAASATAGDRGQRQPRNWHWTAGIWSLKFSEGLVKDHDSGSGLKSPTFGLSSHGPRSMFLSSSGHFPQVNGSQ